MESNILFSLFVATLVPISILAGIALWSPRRVWVKGLSLILVILIFPMGYITLSELLSRPKPLELVWRVDAISKAAQSVGIPWLFHDLKEAIVLNAQMHEGKAIYLWLSFDGVDEPRAYVLPWDEKLARQLQGARRNAEASGTRVKMRLPFENSLDRRDQVFYAAPQLLPPEKQTPIDNPFNFEGNHLGGEN